MVAAECAMGYALTALPYRRPHPVFAPKPLSHDVLAPGGLPATPWRFLWLFIRRRFLGRTLLLNLMAAGGVGTMGIEPGGL